MMAERLAEIRRDLDSEAYTSYLPKTVRELLDYIDGLKFANGVLDSAAKDAQAWSVRAQTAEAKCAQLEAHKAESMQVFAALQIQEIAKEIGAPLGSGVAEHILPWIKTAKAQLEAQRGGAVVVPTKMDDDDWEAIGFQQSTEGQLQRVWDRAISRIQPISADRVLGDGMVGVDENYMSDLEETVIDVVESLDRGFVVCQNCGSQEDTSTLDVMSMDLMPMKARIDALRSAKGEVEG